MRNERAGLKVGCFHLGFQGLNGFVCSDFLNETTKVLSLSGKNDLQHMKNILNVVCRRRCWWSEALYRTQIS